MKKENKSLCTADTPTFKGEKEEEEGSAMEAEREQPRREKKRSAGSLVNTVTRGNKQPDQMLLNDCELTLEEAPGHSG